eukprot:3834817-Amphidinium_carterae.3
MKDGGSQKAWNLEHGHTDVQTVREQWAREATELVRLLHGANRHAEVRPETGHHRKAFQWSCCIDQLLDIMCGKRLSSFVIGEELIGSHPMAWPSLSLCLHQGSDGWAATWFLMSQNVCAMTFFDPAHRCWNDVRQSLKESGLWQSVLALTALCNFDGGPWKDCRFYQEGKASMQEFLLYSENGNAALEEYRPWLLQDLDLVHRDLEPEIEETICNGLRDSFVRKIDRVGLSRWFGVQDSLQQLLPKWTARALAFSYLAVQNGLLDHRHVLEGLAGKVTECSSALANASDARTTSSDKDETVLKQKAMTAVESTTSLLLDRGLRQDARKIVALSGPMRRWHSSQCKVNRSGAESLAWHSSMAAGAWLAPVVETLNLVNEWSFWTDLDTATELRGSHSELVSSHPLVQHQQEEVAQIMAFALALARSRIASQSWYSQGCGSMAALVLESEQTAVLE